VVAHAAIIVAPEAIVRNLKLVSPTLHCNVQQDAHDFLSLLSAAMQRSYRRPGPELGLPVAWPPPGAYSFTMFAGAVQSTVVCSVCAVRGKKRRAKGLLSLAFQTLASCLGGKDDTSCEIKFSAAERPPPHAPPPSPPSHAPLSPSYAHAMAARRFVHAGPDKTQGPGGFSWSGGGIFLKKIHRQRTKKRAF
jgi:hypothetical protein